MHIENFRSVKAVDLTLPALSYFCGANASGKTNFTEALDFISQTFERGLSYAIAEKGGFYNMCFRRERRSRGAIGFDLTGKVQRGKVSLKINIRFSVQTRGQAIRSDFYIENEYYVFNLQSPKGSGYITINRQEDAYVCETSESFPPEATEIYPMIEIVKQFFENSALKADPRSLLYPSPYDFFPFASEIRNLTAARVFRINPRTARQSGAPSVLGQLGKYGENLPSALDDLAINHREAFGQLEEVLREVMPGLTSLKTRYTASRQMGLFLQERGFGSPWDAEELSDGTLMSMALFLAVLHPSHNWVVIEEPENSLHPWILRKFLELCKEVSSHRQLVLTTQSPLVVASASPDRLFLVERREGITSIAPALEREGILPEMLNRRFLDLGQYWMGGGLGAVPLPDPSQEDLFSEDDE